MHTTATPSPLSSTDLREQLAELEAKIQTKSDRLTEVGEEIVAARAERDRLHRDDAAPPAIAAHRQRMRDLEDEGEGLTGAIALLRADVEAHKREIAAAVEREKGSVVESAARRGNEALHEFEEDLAAFLAGPVAEVISRLESVSEEIRDNEKLGPGAGDYHNRVVRPHARLHALAFALHAYARGESVNLQLERVWPAQSAAA